jgi:putative transposase
MGLINQAPAQIKYTGSMKFNPEFNHRHSVRLKGFDYSAPGLYFITVSTLKKEPFFGQIASNRVILSEIGKIVREHWTAIPRHFDNVKINEFVIMPNHLHGVLRIVENTQSSALQHIESPECRGVQLNAPTKIAENYFSAISPKANTISVIIRTFKAAVTTTCRQNNLDFYWQRSFYEHIIRSDKELFAIREYIKNNPMNWEKDNENITGRN